MGDDRHVRSSNALFQAKELKLYIGKVTVLINNAGIIHGKNFFESDDDEIKQTIDTNLMGHIWVS